MEQLFKGSTDRQPDVPQEREDELYWLWGNETEDEETQEWRDELTADEAALVGQWDKQYSTGFAKLVEEIRRTEVAAAQPEQVEELEL